MTSSETFRECLQAIIDWADLALANPSTFNAHGVRNLAGPIFDDARAALAAHGVRTDDVASEAELRELFSMDDEDGPLEHVIATCAGEWRHEDGRWRFWDTSGDDEGAGA